ncbi:Spy/CpxP family protein refolding chaperone [Phenylobacterium sp.]|uniref:Spy/CpxP family protein refolding chaperone n=1 Tax=Phenylobacterium sp. TaxID=1871053 RepID=UPI0035AF76B9
MTLKILRPVLLGASILTLGAAGVAIAQPPPGGMGEAHGHGPMGGMPGMDPAKRGERMAGHLRDVLQLTPAQEPALQAFIAAMKPPEGGLEKMRGEREKMAGLTTPQRLDAMQAHRAEREAAMDKRMQAIRTFYAQLNPAQKKAFDALPPPGMGGRHGQGMGPKGMGAGHRG